MKFYLKNNKLKLILIGFTLYEGCFYKEFVVAVYIKGLATHS